MKKIGITLIIGLNVLSCTFSQKSKDVFSVTEELLKRDNYVIPDSLFLFFPDNNKSIKYENLNIIKISENAEKTEIPFKAIFFTGYEIIEAYQCENKEFLQQLQEEYSSKSLFVVKSEDKDYFVISSERELLKAYDSLQLQDYYTRLKDKVILSFKESFNDMPFLYDSTTISGLPVGYEILVLKSGNKFVLPEDHLYEWSILPENLKHGYRSGVAFKEGEPYIIYWLVAW